MAPKTQIQQSDMTPAQVQRMVNRAWIDGCVYAWNGSPEEAVFGILQSHDADKTSGLLHFEVRNPDGTGIGQFFNVRAESLGHPVGSHPTRQRSRATTPEGGQK